MRVGVIGLGRMGAPMTRRMIDGGHDVAIWNRTAAKGDSLVAAGASAAESAAALAEHSDVVVTCVSDTTAVEAVVFGPAGIAEGARPGAVLVDHSSIAPWSTREMAARLVAGPGMAWLDAPVSGGVKGAEAGTLAVMAGGDEETLARVRPVIDCYAAEVTLMGDVGAGQVTKLCNQVVVAGTLALVAEAVTLAQAAGIDAGRLPEALAGGWADSAILRTFVPRMVEGYEQPIGAASLMLKDVDTALELARRTEAPLPTSAIVGALYRRLRDAGRGDDDLAAIIDSLRLRAV